MTSYSKQLSLLDTEIDDTPLKKFKTIKSTTKNSDASASAFGWEFQIASAVLLSIQNIKNLKSFVVEGDTEDIELYFTDQSPAYIQAKALHDAPTKTNDASKINEALNTLINASNREKGEYSKLVILVNFDNPLNLDKNLLERYFIGFSDNLFTKNFRALPDQGKEYIMERFKVAQRKLKSKEYNYGTDFFDFDRLFIAIHMYSAFDDNNNFNITRKAIEEFLTVDCHLGSSHLTKVKTLRNMLITDYFSMAGKKKYALKKSELVWRIIVGLMNEPEDFMNTVPDYIKDELYSYTEDNSIIEELSNQGKNRSSILGDYLKYKKSYEKELNDNDIVKKFVNENHSSYEHLFPVEGYQNDELRSWGTKYLIMKILRSRHLINQVKKGANL